jgi:hypothetical protein
MISVPGMCQDHRLKDPKGAVMTGILKPKARVLIARWDLKEAEGKELM